MSYLTIFPSQVFGTMCVIGYRGSAPGIKSKADRYPAVNDTLNLISPDDTLSPSEVFKPGVCISYRAGVLKFQICVLRKQITHPLTLGSYGVFGMDVPTTGNMPILATNDESLPKFSLDAQNTYRYKNDTWVIVSVDGFHIKAKKLTDDGQHHVVTVARDLTSSYDILKLVEDFYRSESSEAESESDTDEMVHPA